MRKILLIALCCWTVQCLWGQDLPPVNVSCKQSPLQEVFKDIEQQTEVSFSYSNDLVEGIKVTGECPGIPLEDCLKELLKYEKIEFNVELSKYILIRYAPDKIIPEREVPPTKLCGTVRDGLTGEGLHFANVAILNTNKGSSTDASGGFSFHARIKSTDSLDISFLGYETQRVAASFFLKSPCAEITLSISEAQTVEVQVTAYLMEGISLSRNTNEVNIHPDELGLMPGEAEPDILAAVKILPGIISPDESASRLHVRGGTPDQNLVLWDGIPVYHTGHYFGSISAFNPYIVDEVKVWRGAFGAEYGGRVSGVIDIRGVQEIPDRIRAGLGLNFTHAHSFAEVPIARKGALSLSFRKSLTDYFNTPTYSKLRNKTFQGTKVEDNNQAVEEDEAIELVNHFTFYDANAKCLFVPNDKDKMELSFFTGQNNLEYSVNDLYEDLDFNDGLTLRNWGVGSIWNRDWSDKIHTKSSVSYSDFNYQYNYVMGYDSLDNNVEDSDKSNAVRDLRINAVGDYRFSERHSISVGYEFKWQNVVYNINTTSLLEEESFSEELNNQGMTQSLYAHYLFQTQKLHLSLGGRYNYYDLANAHFMEPRMSVQYQVLPALRLKASAGLYNQSMSQLVELDFNSLGVNNEVWTLADERDEITKGGQAAAGFLLKKKGWRMDVEAYAKQLRDITSLSTSFGSQADEDNFSTGTAHILGLDIMLKKRWKTYQTWVAYTLAQANYTFPELSPDPFPAFHDQRHTLSWMHLLKWKTFEFSLGWQYHSGLPFTPLENFDTALISEEEEEYYVISPNLGPVNSARLPHYHRLDTSMLYTLSRKKWMAKMGLSFVNLYNRNNVQSRVFTEHIEDFGEPDLEVLEVEKSLLELMPNILLRWEWR